MQKTIEVPGNPMVHLRHIDYADAAALLRVIERNRGNFASYLIWTAQADIIKMLTRIEKQLYLSSEDEGMAYCVIQGTAKEPEEVIGSIRLFQRYPHWRMSGDFDLRGPVAFCGSWIDKESQGQGIMLRARRALFHYAQERWGIENIFMDIATDNPDAERSARILGAEPMNMNYWQMQRPFDFDKPDIPDSLPTSAETRFMLERAAQYNKKISSNTVPMQRWLLRLNTPEASRQLPDFNAK